MYQEYLNGIIMLKREHTTNDNTPETKVLGKTLGNKANFLEQQK